MLDPVTAALGLSEDRCVEDPVRSDLAAVHARAIEIEHDVPLGIHCDQPTLSIQRR